jgi:hypothetical protein
VIAATQTILRPLNVFPLWRPPFLQIVYRYLTQLLAEEEGKIVGSHGIVTPPRKDPGQATRSSTVSRVPGGKLPPPTRQESAGQDGAARRSGLSSPLPRRVVDSYCYVPVTGRFQRRAAVALRPSLGGGNTPGARES